MSENKQTVLTIGIDMDHLPVSYFSSLLRVVQAAAREVGRAEEKTHLQFERQPQPILLLSGIKISHDLMIHVTFADPLDSSPLVDLSTNVFNALLDRFSEYVKGLPQPGLWGGPSPGSPRRPFDSDVMRRMDQIYRELRRSSKASIRFLDRTVEVEGDHMVMP